MKTLLQLLTNVIIKWGVQKCFHYLYGRKFSLVTDHQPLVHILAHSTNCQTCKLLVYSFMLYFYNTSYWTLSTRSPDSWQCRLSVKASLYVRTFFIDMDNDSLFHLQQFDILPITANEIARATQEDEDLNVVFKGLHSGIPLRVMNLQFGCILYGLRVYRAYKVQADNLT